MTMQKAIEIIEELGNFIETTNEYSNGMRRAYNTCLGILKKEADKPCKKFLVIKPSADGKSIDKLGLFFEKHHCNAFLSAQKAFDDDMRAMASYPVDDLPDGWIFKI